MHKKVLKICSLICLTCITHPTPSNPTQATVPPQQEAPKPASIENPLAKKLSGLIVMEYLAKRKKIVETDAKAFKDKSREEKLGISTLSNSFSASQELTINLSPLQDNLFVFDTTVLGTPEEFDAKETHILPHEKELLKYKLIKAYNTLKKPQEPNNNAPCLIILDSHTKCYRPDHPIRRTENAYSFLNREETVTDRLLMRCKTFLTQAEFEIFITQHWPTLDTPPTPPAPVEKAVPQKTKKSGWFS
jgi:hypothetical protein